MAVVRKPNSALILVGHGSTVNPESSAPTWAHADAIRARHLFGEVRVAFWKEEPSLRQVLYSIESDDVYVVPNFIGNGYFTGKVIPRELRLTGAVTRQAVRCGSETRIRTVRYCEPVGNHSRMTEVLLHRAREIAPEAPPDRTCLLIVGHGTELNDNSAAAVKREVERIDSLGCYAEVQAAFMEESPFVADWRTLTAQPNVIVVPFFIADGLHTARDIPLLLGIPAQPGQAESLLASHSAHRLFGRDLYYASAIGTEPLLADVILDQVTALDEAFPPDCRQVVPPLERSPYCTAALARLKALGRIGQVSLRAGPEHSWLLCHVDDSDRLGTLARFTRPEDARALANHDDTGCYRPLKSAPNLRHGWQLEIADDEQLFLAIELLYPAMLGIWSARESGGLEVVPLRETLNRQSGMFAITSQITDETALEVVRGCCRSDGACLKTILWGMGTESDTGCQSARAETAQAGSPCHSGSQPGGGFPLFCHEACNFWVAAARRALKAP